MDLDPLGTMRQERAMLAPTREQIARRIAVLSRRRLPSRTRDARIEELRGVLAMLPKPTTDRRNS